MRTKPFVRVLGKEVSSSLGRFGSAMAIHIPHMPTALQPCSPAALQPCSPTALQPYSPRNPAALQ